MSDYVTDPRPFAECLKDFALRLNNGNNYGSRPLAEAELCVPRATLAKWLNGGACDREASMRKLMTLILRARSRNP